MSAIRVQRQKPSSRSTAKKPELKVVPRRKSKKLIKRTGARRLAPFTIMASIAIAGIVSAILLEQVVLAQSAFELHQIRLELAEAEENREVLMLEAAKLDSDARVERYARETLGMVDPSPQFVRYIVADIGLNKRSASLATTTDPYLGTGGADTAAAASASP
ncbi:MAG: septum formation initiator family protein [Actinomycetota bacterium]